MKEIIDKKNKWASKIEEKSDVFDKIYKQNNSKKCKKLRGTEIWINEDDPTNILKYRGLLPQQLKETNKEQRI